LTGCKNFVSKREKGEERGREKFIFNTFVYLKPMQRFDNGSDMCGFRSFNNSASKRVLDLLEPVKLTVWKVVIERITVVKFRVLAVLKSRYGRIHCEVHGYDISMI